MPEVKPQGTQPVPAMLKFESGQSVEGTVVNVAYGGLVLTCRGLSPRSQELGGRVMLAVKAPGFEGQPEAQGHLEAARPDDKGLSRLKIRLDDAADLARLMDAGLARIFNRRGAYRVAPSELDPVFLLIQAADGFEYHDKASDISATGLGLIASQEVADQLANREEFVLKMALPGYPHEIHFMAQVRRCLPRDAGVLIGVDFDPTRSPNFEGAQDQIITYIMKRQRELLREGSREA